MLKSVQIDDEPIANSTETGKVKNSQISLKKIKCKYPLKVTAPNQSVPIDLSIKNENENHGKNKCLIVDKILESSKSNSIFDTQKLLPSSKKPPITLSCLIFMAIEESVHKCLPVRDIYEWIESRFPYYQSVSKGWKSSIRHNLSFSKCFKKMDRSEATQLLANQSMQSQNFKTKTLISGTCWKINSECKMYLTQALKKSSYWLSSMSQACNLSLKAAIECDEIDDKDYFASCQNENEKSDENLLMMSASVGLKADENLSVSHEEVIESSCDTGNCDNVEMMRTCTSEIASDDQTLKENIFEEHDANKSILFSRNKFYYKSNKILHNNLKRRLSKSLSGENAKRVKPLPDVENRVVADASCSKNENISDVNCAAIGEEDAKKAAEEILLLNQNVSNTLIENAKEAKGSDASVDCATNSDLEIEVASTLVRLKSLMENRN